MAEWKAIKELFDIEKGSLQSSKNTPGEYPFITAAEDWKTHSSYEHDCEALVFAMAASGSLGRTHYVNGKFISSDLCFVLTPKKDLKLDLLFYHRLFNFLRQNIVKKTATGTSKLSINRTNFNGYKLPYFDYDYQVIFRDKIENLATIHDKFIYGIDIQLNLIYKLRQQLLQEATEGKLTSKWRRKHPELISGDNHASKLLEKIKAEKERLVKEGKIKKEKPLAALTDNEKPFDLPDGWVWCRLGEISNFIDYRGKTPTKTTSGIRLITAKNVKKGSLSLEPEEFISEAEYQQRMTRGLPQNGDIFFTTEAPLGNVCLNVLTEKMSVGQRIITIHPFMIDSKLLMYQLLSKTIQSEINNRRSGITAEGIKSSRFRLIPMPVPPLAEQQAIVSKVSELMAMVDELEKQVLERREQSEMLMQSVLREAFATN